MRTIIAGSRALTDYAAVCAAIEAAGWEITEVVSGCAAGADKLGEQWAAERGIPIRRSPADWKTYRRAAGPRRNREMAGYAEALVAVWDGQSRGTANMIELAKRAGLRVYVHRFPPIKIVP